MQIIKSSCPLYIEPNERSELISEGLFGETVKILKKDKDWVYCQLITDEYLGWTKVSYIDQNVEVNYRVFVNRSNIYTNADIRSKVSFYLPLGSLLNVIEINYKWAQISYISNNKNIIGFVPFQHITKIKEFILDWVAVAEHLINTPYRWGGRDTIGLDCSSLVQLSLQTNGINVPRDTRMQENLRYPKTYNLNNLKRGMLVFWKGHVAILTDKKNIIHANAYHMRVIIEPLIKANNRIKKNNGEIKYILNLNSLI